MTTERALFATKLGGVFAAVGSAVGLGNVWRFPYETGSHGGAAFLLVYLACVLLLGTPLLLAELVLGRATHQNPTGAFRKLAPGTHWYLLGYLGAFCMILIVAFYGVVAGWTLCYTTHAALGSVPDFAAFSSSLWGPLLWMTLFFCINGAILLGGVRKGIERASNILMPLLAVMLVVLCINSLSLDNARAGLEFLFYPDFSKIDAMVIVSALGQSFFSISVGICCLLTYGSYLPNSTKLGRSALTITLLDTLFAILSGIIIFPACFAFQVQPDQGPGLAFVTLPDVFQQMPGGMLWCFAFFLLLVVAALTSSLSMLETPTAILQEEFHMSRKKAVLVATTIGWLLSILCALSFCPDFSDSLSIGGMIVFDLFDKTTANIIMPFSATLMAIFVGWVMDKKLLRDNVNNFRQDGKTVWYYKPFLMAVRFIAPLCILLIFLNGLGVFELFSRK
ncbi:MAG: sodium-dependent transporter [Bacteroidales bacterium]|nr:sodium-dependent transporter [Bacteroidales bacterium]